MKGDELRFGSGGASSLEQCRMYSFEWSGLRCFNRFGLGSTESTYFYEIIADIYVGRSLRGLYILNDHFTSYSDTAITLNMSVVLRG